MQHLDDGVIQELVDGEIPSRDLPPLQAHLAGCEACTSRLEAARMAATEADELLLMLDEVEPSAPVAAPVVIPIPRPHWSRNLAWAASLMLAVGLGYAGRDTINGVLGLPAREVGADLTAPTMRAIPAAPPAAPSEAVPEQRRGVEPRTDPAVANPQGRQASPVARNGQTETVPPAQEVARDQVAPPPAPVVVGAASGAGAEAARQTTRIATEQESAVGERRERLARSSPPAAQNALAPARSAGSLEMADAAKALIVTREVDLPGALRLLGGSIKLIDGMVPLRLDAAGDEVIVVYQVIWGDVLLSQRRVGERIEWRLTGPAGYPADSLAVLRARVKP
jgi:hypothetical protein